MVYVVVRSAAVSSCIKSILLIKAKYKYKYHFTTHQEVSFPSSMASDLQGHKRPRQAPAVALEVEADWKSGSGNRGVMLQCLSLIARVAALS